MAVIAMGFKSTTTAVVASGVREAIESDGEGHERRKMSGREKS